MKKVKKDFIVVDTDTPDLTPAGNLIRTVVINGLGSDVDTVVQNKKNLILGKGAILEDVRHRYLSVA